MKKLIILFVLLSLGVVLNPFNKKDDPKRFLPPTYEGIESIGCKVEQVSTGKDSFWHVHVWIAYKEGILMKLFAIRPVNERMKALEDCNWWMEFVRKNAPKPKPPQVRS